MTILGFFPVHQSSSTDELRLCSIPESVRQSFSRFDQAHETTMGLAEKFSHTNAPTDKNGDGGLLGISTHCGRLSPPVFDEVGQKVPQRGTHFVTLLFLLTNRLISHFFRENSSRSHNLMSIA